MHRFKIFLLLSVISIVACKNNNSKKEQPVTNAHSGHDAKVMSGYADSVNSGLIAEDTMKKSTPRVAMATIGATHVHISYASPGVKGRVIWGGLVPYNTVWVTGAHAATNIKINKPVVINNTTVEAGTYAIFTIPGEKEWIFILNKNYQQHLADDYTDKEDVLRFTIKPEENKMTQRLTYNVVKKADDAGSIEILWEKIKLVVPFKTAS
ncbi:MAG: hypothetical protein RIR48_2073 [Bacteroidota bacterium]